MQLVADLVCVPWQICSPTRSAFMTGRYTIRLGTHANVIYWDTPWGVPINETFLPQNMKDAGYHTAMFGAILLTPLAEHFGVSF